MPLANTSRSYGSVTKTFHWLTALLILTVIPLGHVANTLAHTISDPAVPVTEADVARAAFLFSLHKTTGICIFLVALARIAWALSQPKPGLLNADNRPEALAAETVHWLLYGSLLLVPLTGWIHHAATEGFAPIWWPFGQSLPFVDKSPEIAALTAGLHWVLQWVLVGALILHVAGALKHHVVDRDHTLRRMLPGRSDPPEPPAQRHGPLPALAAVAAWAVALAAGGAIGAYAPHRAAQPTAQALDEVQSDWTVTTGTLELTVAQLGSPVTGRFENWTAAITFDEPQGPGPAGTVEVVVSIGSLTLGSVTDQALGPDFFDAGAFPTARFNGTLIRTEDGYIAQGPLTIRDQTIDIELPFTLTLNEGTAEMTGGLTLNRLDFGIGRSMSDESSLAFAVEIAVALTAERAGP